MKILLDGTVFGNSFQKGIQRYVSELVANTAADVSLMHDNEGGISFPHAIADHVLKPFHKRLPGRNLPLRMWRGMHRKCAMRGFDLYHTPYMGMAPSLKLPSVMVVHDMVCERFPEQFAGDAASESNRKKRALEAATQLIAISQATADDLLSIYPQYAGRVTVIHHGAEHLAKEDYHNFFVPDHAAPYVLFVGDRAAYKNFRCALLAMKESAWPSDLILKVAGPPPSDEELREVDGLNLAQRIDFLGRVDDATLVGLYKQATCFLFPSLHEGFGFPLIEAQRCGAPVVASRIPVFLEIGGDGFEAFDPLDPASLSGAVLNSLEPERSTTLRQRGYANSMRFSWRTTAQKTIEVWKGAMNQ